jgi:hypothetical protein
MTDLADPTCSDCIAFYQEAKDELGRIMGRCRLRSELGDVPASLPGCYLFRVKESRRELVKAITPKTAVSKRRTGAEVSDTRPTATLGNPVVGDTTGEWTMDRDGLKQVLRELLEEETLYGYPEMQKRYTSGVLVIKPADEALQTKEIPLDVFFHKIVMIRDRLRVLEAKINSFDGIGEEDKVELQSYISKCYGTLTTFNILFADKSDQFRSK